MKSRYDVVVIGSGLAGLSAVLGLEPHFSVLMLTKRDLKLNNSSLAQGGIAAVFDTINDSTEAHFNDSLVAGEFKNNTGTLSVLVDSAYRDVSRLIELGVEFDRDPDGSIRLTLEGGHSRNRILHHRDTSGKAIVDALDEVVTSLPNVDIVEYATVAGIKKEDGFFFLNILSDNEPSPTVIGCTALVIATGGIGRVYERTTNSAIATGDGIVFARELGAAIKNLHYVQFHPTAFKDENTRECFLISEAVRGEGAYLIGPDGDRFMRRYDERMELAPRNVVSGAIIAEQRRTGGSEFYLDITHKPASFLTERFPMIYQNLLEFGVDMTTQTIPVYPCQHYLMGGIDTDEDARTAVDGLYAAGECAHTGVHGRNRLASNSLLEALVFGRRAAADINRKFSPDLQPGAPPEFANGTKPVPKGIRSEIRAIMQESYFVVPDEEKAASGFERIKEILDVLESGDFELTTDYVEAKSLATVAYLILKKVVG